MTSMRKQKKELDKMLRLLHENKHIASYRHSVTDAERQARLIEKRDEFNHITKIVATHHNSLLNNMN